MQDRPGPPATLIIIGFNQEALVDLAISGAFAQDYGNLQIILSDDGSTDATFARMNTAATVYSGPHSVLASRTPANRGTLAHIYDAFAKSTGELIVLAAADDISYPHRVRTLVEAWRTNRPAALFSKYDVIDAGGAVTARDYSYDSTQLEFLDYFLDGRVVPVHGASSAYSREVFDLFPLPATRIFFEDTFFSLGLALLRRPVLFVDAALVQYREHDGSITNTTEVGGDHADVLKRERRGESYAASLLNVLDWFAGLAARTPDAGPLNREAMDADRRFYALRSRWIDMSSGSRMSALPSVRRASHRRWLLARLAGVHGLAIAKSARKMMRKQGRSKLPASA